MSLKFLADHCVPGTIMESLKQNGHAVHRLTEYLPADSNDAIVIAKAKEENAILLSLNGDFADIVAYPPSEYAGIICSKHRDCGSPSMNLVSSLTRRRKARQRKGAKGEGLFDTETQGHREGF
jgi:hypothetical protein